MNTHSDWLLDADDVVAHLFFAAGTIDEVTLEHEGGAFKGVLRFPDGDNEGVFIASPGVAFGKLPSVVTVSYRGRPDQYRFFSRITEVTVEGVRVDFPTMIERSDRRLTERHLVPPGSGFAFRLTGRGAPVVLPLYDVSVGGLGILAIAGPEPKEGDLLDGDLLLPGELPISLRLVVRHLAPPPGGTGEEVVVGGRITRISTGDRGRLARYLIQWLPR